MPAHRKAEQSAKRESQDLSGRLVGRDDLLVDGIPDDHPARRHRLDNAEWVVCQLHVTRSSPSASCHALLASRRYGLPTEYAAPDARGRGRLSSRHSLAPPLRVTMLRLLSR